jgi:hypothetical protein
MLNLGLLLVAVGLVTIFGAFSYAASNMSRTVNPTSWKSGDSNGVFENHSKAMKGMALGGLLTALGVLSMVASYLIK